MKIKLLILFMSLVYVFSSCKDNNNNDDDNGGANAGTWDMDIQVNITEPEPSPFEALGVVDVNIDGNNVTFTGDYTIGNQTHNNLVFYGTFEGNKVTLNTNETVVQFTFNDTLYTEHIAWVMSPFYVDGSSGIGGGTLVATKNPGNTVESGTFTFTVQKR